RRISQGPRHGRHGGPSPPVARGARQSMPAPDQGTGEGARTGGRAPARAWRGFIGACERVSDTAAARSSPTAVISAKAETHIPEAEVYGTMDPAFAGVTSKRSIAFSMTPIDSIVARLLGLHPRLIDLSLDRMWRILDALGHPQRSLPPVIHVAGTNGKGSTIAFLRAILEAAGLRVHVYTSPHLVRFNE